MTLKEARKKFLPRRTIISGLVVFVILEIRTPKEWPANLLVVVVLVGAIAIADALVYFYRKHHP